MAANGETAAPPPPYSSADDKGEAQGAPPQIPPAGQYYNQPQGAAYSPAQGVYPPPPHQVYGSPNVVYTQGPQGGTATVVVTSAPTANYVAVVPNCGFCGEYPCQVTCPYCRAQVTTRTSHENGLLTWLLVGLLILIGCWLGCCLIPLCVDGCKDVDHSCPNCSRHIHRYKRM